MKQVPYLLLSSLLLAGLFLLGACGDSSPTPQQPGETPSLPAGVDVVITLNSIGDTAWYVAKLEGNETVAATGIDNPNAAWTLKIGSRYRVVNAAGSSAHPFELLGDLRLPLLSQIQDGNLEASAAIDYVEDREGVTFTMTADLAAAVEIYYCNFHEAMQGSVSVQ